MAIRAEPFGFQIKVRIAAFEHPDGIGRPLDGDLRKNALEQHARGFVPDGRAPQAAAHLANDEAADRIERTDRLCEDHRRLVGSDRRADDARVVEETARAGRVLQQSAASREDDVGARDRGTNRAEVGTRRRLDAIAATRRFRLVRKHVDCELGMPAPQLADRELEQRLVAEISEAVVTGKQQAQGRRLLSRCTRGTICRRRDRGSR